MKPQSWPSTVAAHRSTEVSDSFGSRSCTLVFSGDNRAYAVDAEGNATEELATVTVRATEFTTPESMPAVLPPNSAFTYCVELQVDGAERARFDKPVTLWVDNFLGFPVGEKVPVGYYDRDRGVWAPSDSGRVVRLLDTNGDDIVDALDANGDALPDDLNANGSFADEVAGLADLQKYPSGATFWRVSITHFTPWDCNWPYGSPQDAIPPNPEGDPDADEQKPEPKVCPLRLNSFVEERGRIFHEDIPIPGTSITLHYASNRVKGYKYRITVPTSGATVPASLKSMIARVEVAGRTLEQNLDPLPNQKVVFEWDGSDFLGRPVAGAATAHVSIGFVYGAVYWLAGNPDQSFAQAGRAISAVQARGEVITWKRHDMHLPVGTAVIAEGWTVSANHHVNPVDPSTLDKGDGGFIKNDTRIITTTAGTAQRGYSGDGGPALNAEFGPNKIAVDAAGNQYLADYYNQRIRKIDTGGIVTTVAGTGVAGFSGDGGPALNARLYYPSTVAVDVPGNLYITEFNYQTSR